MRASSLSLQRSLFRHQARQISEQVQGGSAQFRAYQRRYEVATRRFRRAIELHDVDARVAQSDVVYVGDYHTLRMAQQAYLKLAQSAVSCGRRVVLALEFVESKHQSTLDSFLAGRVSEKTFLSRIGHPYRGPFDIWPAFAPIFELAKKAKLEVRAIDRRAVGPRSLEMRDQGAAVSIAQTAKAADRPLVLVLMGQFHVTPCHLPRKVQALLGKHERRALVIYQNAEGVYWSLARGGRVEATRAVEISASELCLVNASPVVCQRSFLDYVEAEAGDARLEDPGIAETFRHLAGAIGRLAGINVGKAADEVMVLRPGDLDVHLRLKQRANFTSAELRQLAKHVFSLESAFIPRAQAVWLSSMSLNNAAEEAARFVRHVCVGNRAVRPRAHPDGFFAACLEAALGFLGSRLVNPKRRCTQLDEWAWHFESSRGETKRVAAFTLALAGAVSDGLNKAPGMVPKVNTALFMPVSRALGSLLGEALAQAFASKKFAATEVSALFFDPFPAPARTFVALSRRLALFVEKS